MFDLVEAKTKTVHMERRIVQKAVSKEAAALTLQQKKLLFFLISNINKEDTQFHEITISIADYFKLIGVDEGGTDRKRLKKEIEDFANKSFWIEDEEQAELYRWVNTAKINFKKKEITLELHKTVMQFLLNLDDKSRAIFQLGYALTFKHKYSPDFYAFAASIKDFMIKKNTMYKMTLESATQKFGSGRYAKFNDWKKRVLEPAIEEINEKTDLNLKVEFLCRDKTYKKKVTHILFGVTMKVGADLAKVRVNALSINLESSLQTEANELADGYVEEYAVNALGFSILDLNAKEVLNATENLKRSCKMKK